MVGRFWAVFEMTVEIDVTTLQGKTLFITGASRGIGLAIALRAARDGANIAIASKSAEPHPKLEGTIFQAAEEVEKAGGKALPIQCDVRSEEDIEAAVAKTAETFGGVDICVNNASAISLMPLEKTDPKRFDLMFQVNARGTVLVSKACLPHLEKASNPHILMLSPPLDMNPMWFSGKVSYAIAKYGMSLAVLGLADELKRKGIAVNALWPRSTIATAAIKFALGGDALMSMSRKPEIIADAAHLIFTQDSKSFTGNFLIDDTFLAEVGGVRDFEGYRVDPSKPLAPDFFVPQDCKPPAGVEILSLWKLQEFMGGKLP